MFLKQTKQDQAQYPLLGVSVRRKAVYYQHVYLQPQARAIIHLECSYNKSKQTNKLTEWLVPEPLSSSSGIPGLCVLQVSVLKCQVL